MDRLVRVVCIRDVDRHGIILRNSGNWLGGYASQYADGSSYFDYHRRRCHRSNEDRQQDSRAGRMDPVVVCPHCGRYHECREYQST